MTIDEKIAALEFDVIEMKRMQAMADRLAEEDNEGGEGGAMVIAVKALIGLAVMHYEEEIATLKGPEAA
jgi:hypothetical protein